MSPIFSGLFAAAIILAEVVTWVAAGQLELRSDPRTVALMCSGLLAAFALVLPREGGMR